MTRSDVSISLSELDAEIVSINSLDLGTALSFLCPVCRRHRHLLYFNPGVLVFESSSTGRNIWANPMGNSVCDLTLYPSYRSTTSFSDGNCHLHAIFRSGSVLILSDSNPPIQDEEETCFS